MNSIKSIVPPSLLSDPAFSADPYSNPYFASGELAWASSAPPGHPTLKNKNRRIPSAQPSLDLDDSDFQLVQPPNSPVPPNSTSYFTFPPNPSSSQTTATATASSSSPPSTERPFSLVPTTSRAPSPPPPRVKQEKKKRRMPFLTRRKSASQVDSGKSLSVPDIQKAPVATSSVSFDDVTGNPRPSPSVVLNGAARPVLSSTHRSVSAGATTPSVRSAITAGSRSTGISNDSNSSARAKNLDRIDELDETNPWGISLHHGGPYEAAIRGLKQGRNSLDDLSNSEQSRRGLHSHPNFYMPPQVPPGVSLNLSPGQILPRNFNIKEWQRPSKRPSPKSAASSSSGQSIPRYRPQMLNPPLPRTSFSSLSPSYPPSLSPRTPLPNPHPKMNDELIELSPASTSYPPSISPRDLLPNPHPNTNIEGHEPIMEQHDSHELESEKPLHDVSFDIGMAMLRPEASQSQNLTIFLRPGASNDQEFDPYDPAHLELHHSRSPSPLPYAATERSRQPTPEPHGQHTPSNESIDDTRNDTAARKGEEAFTLPQEDFRDPPPYVDFIPEDVPDTLQELRDPSESLSGHQPIKEDEVLLHENALSRQEIPQEYPSSVSHSRHNNKNNSDFTPPREQATSSDSGPALEARPLNNWENTQLRTQIPPVSLNNEFTRSQDQMYPTSEPASIYSRDRDARSTHHSISTYASNQSRLGPPPPHRRVPKHLVMPAPLNTRPGNNGMLNPQQPTYTPQQIRPGPPMPSAKVQVHVRSQSHLPFPQQSAMLTHTQPVMRPHEPQAGSSNKLKKRVSMFTTGPSSAKHLPQPQAMTTVSFAPPIVGFGQGPYGGKGIARSNTEKLSRGLLRKGKGEL